MLYPSPKRTEIYSLPYPIESPDMNYFARLVCTYCGATYAKNEIHNVCRQQHCRLPLFALYDIPHQLSRNVLTSRPKNMWRYREMLPIEGDKNIVSLGEGFTPLIHANRLGMKLGMSRLSIKDESVNPTGSFKARGLAMAISKAKELGVTKCAIPTAGNAGGAMSAYCAKAGIEAYVFMPADTPEVFKRECEYFGAHVTLVNGLITDCGKILQERKNTEGWFDVSTLKEPYRVEGKKTMGYEIAEQMNWELPDVIVYPTGGGTGLIGMWKAFEEMEQLGWITSRRPRMISVQAEGCAPIVKAFEQGKEFSEHVEHAHTVASGLRVPKAIGDFLILRVIRESHGLAMTVTDDELMDGVKEIAQSEGIFAAPEGGATWAALKKLHERKLVMPDERIVLCNTGSGYKYIEAIK